ncbi:MAG: IS30 family transposase [Myxococcota bacterium]
MTKTRTRREWTGHERAELWERWRRGESLSAIARCLNRQKGPVHRLVSSAGGFAPAERTRNPRALSLTEREEILRGVAQGLSCRAIARGLGRSASTICRELERNGGRGTYRATKADKRAWDQAKRPKRCKLSTSPRLQRLVAKKLRKNWSPEQISKWLKKEYEANEAMQVSHETIYRTLFIQARGALKKELIAHLRTRRTTRRAKKATSKGDGRGQIPGAISIRERPAEVEDRAVPGHWEGDLIAGTNHSFIGTLVERHTRYVMLLKLKNKEAATVNKALARKIRTLPTSLRQTLTWDRGLEMAGHKEFTLATSVQVYFCDPRSPWQRGSNENTNGLLRQYFPKKTDISVFSQRQLDRVARELNTRPRKTLGWDTPAERLLKLLQ